MNGAPVGRQSIAIGSISRCSAIPAAASHRPHFGKHASSADDFEEGGLTIDHPLEGRHLVGAPIGSRSPCAGDSGAGVVGLSRKSPWFRLQHGLRKVRSLNDRATDSARRSSAVVTISDPLRGGCANQQARDRRVRRMMGRRHRIVGAFLAAERTASWGRSSAFTGAEVRSTWRRRTSTTQLEPATGPRSVMHSAHDVPRPSTELDTAHADR